MAKAIDLLRQGKNEELWQMCCGFLRLNINEFMEIQERLLLQQLELLNKSPLGAKIMRGVRPKTIEEFRRLVQLTSYKDYCPELMEKREDILPDKPILWAHTAGRSGDYTCKWVPITSSYALELSKVLYGIGMISCSDKWGDTSHIPDIIKILYSVAPTPYISGVFADFLRMQSPIQYLPPLEEAVNLAFEDRIRLGFKQAMSQGLDYFFGLSLILVNVGEKIRDSSNGMSLKPFLKSPRALWRLTRGKIKSRLAGRAMLPRDLWSIKGIIGSGVDSLVYKSKIKELWGRQCLDLYACTEGGTIATQVWDYQGMTFIPNLNFLEFIPEEEQVKLKMDRTYIPKTLLLNEVKADEAYEIVITSFHGGAMIRYRIGDMVRINSLRNEQLDIDIPQMAFERRADEILDFVFVRLTEKTIWKAIEGSGIPYVDWIAYKVEGESFLQIYLELADGCQSSEVDITESIYKQITALEDNDDNSLQIRNDFANFVDFKVGVTLLPRGTFAGYTAQRKAEGADLAHLKPPHINPPGKVLSILTSKVEETIVVTKSGIKRQEKPGAEKVSIS